MKTTINGHDVEFDYAPDGRGFNYALKVDGLYIANFDIFESAERRAHAICEHYPVKDFDKKLAVLAKATSYTARGPDALREIQTILAELGNLAVPPRGHSCPACCHQGALYCMNVAAERLRGMRS